MCQPSLGRSGITVSLWAPELGGTREPTQKVRGERAGVLLLHVVGRWNIFGLVLRSVEITR
jgi:hypothetical protein